MTTELKPCPFCGGSNLKVWDNGVECKDCECHWPDLGHCVGEKCRSEAVQMWNRRIPSPEERDIRNSALEEAAKVADEYALIEHPRLSPGSEINAWWSGQERASDFIATGIRALKAEGESR